MAGLKLKTGTCTQKVHSVLQGSYITSLDGVKWCVQKLMLSLVVVVVSFPREECDVTAGQ